MSTLGSLLGPSARGIAHSVNREQVVHSYFRALSVGAGSCACHRLRRPNRQAAGKTLSGGANRLEVLYDAIAVASAADRRFPENQLDL